MTRHVPRSRSRRAAAVILLPALCGVLALGSLGDRVENLTRVPAAVVNLDEIVTTAPADGSTGQKIAAGRLLASALTSPKDDAAESLDWELTDAGDATAGLEDGTYSAVITIPSDFSATVAALAQADGASAEPAAISVTSNDSSSALVGLLSDQIAAASAVSLGRQLTTRFLTSSFEGLSTVSAQLTDAAAGATSLREGATTARAGAAKIDAGARSLGSGLDAVATGATSLRTGTAKLAAGAADLASGLHAASKGAGTLAPGARDVADGASSVRTGAEALSSGAVALRKKTASLPASTRALAGGAATVSGGLGKLTGALASLRSTCTAAGGSEAFCASLAQASTSAQTLAGGATQVANGASGLAASAPALASGVRSLADGAEGLSSGASTLEAGATAVATGAHQLADGVTGAAHGADDLSAGVSGAALGAAQLASGASAAEQGAHDLAGGTGSLVSGLGDLSSGTGSLAEGLAAGAAKVPSYSSAEAGDLARVVAAPVVSTAGRVHASDGGASDPAPLVVALALWLGAFVTFLVRRALAPADLDAPISTVRVALRGWRPALAWGVAQAVLLGAALPLFGVSLASPVAAMGLTLLSTAVFAAVNQALVALWGRTGWIVSVALLVVQAVSLGGLVPIETAPSVFRALNAILPVPVATSGLTHLTLGGQVGSLASVVAVLLLWLVGSIAVTTLVAGARRGTSVRRLRAELVGV